MSHMPVDYCSNTPVYGGWYRIRTYGTFVQWVSRPPHSTRLCEPSIWRKIQDLNLYILRWTAFEAVAIPLRQSSMSIPIPSGFGHHLAALQV
jgi:hypothetical protein